MKRNTSLFAVLVLAAIVAVVPAASAQRVHLISAGSSAVFNATGIAAYNDLAIGTAAAPGIVMTAPCTGQGVTTNGVTCTASHWSLGSSLAAANVHDGRVNQNEAGNLWIVWVTCTTVGPGTCPAVIGPNGTTDIWADLSLDSTVGLREYLGRDAAGNASIYQLPGPFGAGANKINHLLFVGGASDTAVAPPADVITALNNQPLTAAWTDIRAEDGVQATNRIIQNCPAAGCNTAGIAGEPVQANPCPSSDTGVPGAAVCNGPVYFHSYTLGYGAGAFPALANTGTPIASFWTASVANPVLFALPGVNDPITGHAVPGTIQHYAIGESPIIAMANRTNAAGLGQLLVGIPACNGLNNNTDNVVCVNDPANGGPVANGGSGLGFGTAANPETAAGNSYAIRDLLDQHPFPAQAGVFANTTYSSNNPGSGLCFNPGFSATGQCKVVRRPLGALFGGNLCETVSQAFTWPLDSALAGIRPGYAPTGGQTVAPVYLMLREALSGTYNTFEYTEVRRFGGTAGNFNWDPVALTWGYQAYLSQEDNVDGSIAASPTNPLNETCTAAFADPGAEGMRFRSIGTGEVVSGAGTSAGAGHGGIYNGVTVGAAVNTDVLGYLFFSFGNVNPSVPAGAQIIPRNPHFGYLMINGVDPLFANYNNTGANPGQPATAAAPLSWGELPNCTPGGGAGVPDCTAAAVWNGGPTYPNLRNGTYPSWSELRLICDPGPAAGACSVAQDAFGAEALIQNIQGDIHFSRLGGVPDFLPFSDAAAGVNSFTPPYGDAGFIRDHSASLPAGTQFPAGSGHVSTFQYSSFALADDYEDTFHGGSPYIRNNNPQTQHKTIPPVTPTCAVGVNSPPNSECGGDVGGWVIAAPGNVVTNGQGQLQ
jgi:hypothetical protein